MKEILFLLFSLLLSISAMAQKSSHCASLGIINYAGHADLIGPSIGYRYMPTKGIAIGVDVNTEYEINSDVHSFSIMPTVEYRFKERKCQSYIYMAVGSDTNQNATNGCLGIGYGIDIHLKDKFHICPNIGFYTDMDAAAGYFTTGINVSYRF